MFSLLLLAALCIFVPWFVISVVLGVVFGEVIRQAHEVFILPMLAVAVSTAGLGFWSLITSTDQSAHAQSLLDYMLQSIAQARPVGVPLPYFCFVFSLILVLASLSRLLKNLDARPTIAISSGAGDGDARQ